MYYILEDVYMRHEMKFRFALQKFFLYQSHETTTEHCWENLKYPGKSQQNASCRIFSDRVL